MQYGKFVRRVYASYDEWLRELTFHAADSVATEQHREQQDASTETVSEQTPPFPRSSLPLLEQEVGI